MTRYFSGGTVLRRQRIVVATSAVVHASYHPSESQIITLSIDGSLAYWEVVDGEEIRGVKIIGQDFSVLVVSLGSAILQYSYQ